MLAGTASALMLGTAGEATAQWSPRIGIGYVANAPHQYVGVSAHFLTGILGGLGLYVDGKLTRPTTRDRDNFQTEWTAEFVDENFGDEQFGSESEYITFNAALMRPVTPELMLYAGAGISEQSVYVEYFDVRRERGKAGFYWAEDTALNDRGLNVLGGAFFRIASNVALQFGVEAQPRGVTVGATYAIPLGR